MKLEKETRECLEFVMGPNDKLLDYMGNFKSEDKFKAHFKFFGSEREPLIKLARAVVNVGTVPERRFGDTQSQKKVVSKAHEPSAVNGPLDLVREETELFEVTRKNIGDLLGNAGSRESFKPKVTIGDNGELDGSVSCPVCLKTYKSSRTQFNKWSVSNLKRHVLTAHQRDETDERKVKKPRMKKGSVTLDKFVTKLSSDNSAGSSASSSGGLSSGNIQQKAGSSSRDNGGTESDDSIFLNLRD